MFEITLPAYAKETIIRFIKDFVKNKNVLIGLSGGLDSATVTKLCVEALGEDRVKAIHMPDKITPSSDFEDAEYLADELGIEYKVISIDRYIETMKADLKLENDLSIANLKARIRMSILYAIANEEKRLVAGTSNKSELLVGYFTKYGDGASDFAPIGDLYKTQVRHLAKALNIPDRIISKAPSAGLLPNQTDEKEIGIKYETLDKILYGIELGFSPIEISKILSIKVDTINKVVMMHENSKHKRVMLYIPKIGYRTVNTDWRE